MRQFPIFLNLAGVPALVVGGTEEALRKLRLLLAAEAMVTVVAPTLVPEIAGLAADNRITHHARAFAGTDLLGMRIVFAASGDTGLDQAVSTAAQANGIPVNVPDRPDLCGFTMPAVVDRAPITVAIGSGGAAPVLARRLRAQIEALLPTRLGRLAGFADSFRGAVKARIADTTARRRFWEQVFEGPIATAVLKGAEPEASERMLRALNGPDADTDTGGTVALVGVGPGDADLLTFRAMRLMQEADIVIHDRLIGPAILDYVRRDAERIDAGKQRGRHRLSQDEINALMLTHARAGRRVVRLKGGDPMIFGRGGEEAAWLREHGVPVTVVPGITAALGAAAEAGMGLTHRDFSSGALFLTGHAKAGTETPSWASLDDTKDDWLATAARHTTLVIYMGLARVDAISSRLLRAGLPADTPVAVIENATRDDSRRVHGSLGELAFLVRRDAIKGPALIVVGHVTKTAASHAPKADRHLPVSQPTSRDAAALAAVV